jgi:hypothetical protein
MLTLDPITLFFHTLREQSQANNKGLHYNVAGWVAKVHNTRPRSDYGSSGPSLAGRSQTTKTSASASSKRSTLGANINVKIAAGNEELEGLSDQDETFGIERDAAHSSPVKPPKVRATSAVSREELFGIISQDAGSRCYETRSSSSHKPQSSGSSSHGQCLAWTVYPNNLPVA